MCDLGKARYTTLHHLETDDSQPLDIWLCENVPHDYRVVSVIPTVWDHGIGYQVLLELIME